MRKLLILIIFPAFVLAGCTKKDIELSDPSSLSRIDPSFNFSSRFLDDVLQQEVSRNMINGATAIVVKNGQVIYDTAFGFNNVQEGNEMRRDNIFRIASMSKPIMATAIMMLHESGKIGLDDPVSRYIPAFADPKVITNYSNGSYSLVPARTTMTIRHLLSHTSGLGYPAIGSDAASWIYTVAGIPSCIGTSSGTLKDMVSKLAKLPLLFHPGEGFEYGISNDVLGYIVEVVTGMTLDRFLQENIFHPLGMMDTHFYLPQDKQERLVKFYSYEGKNIAADYSAWTPLGTDPNFPNTNGSFYAGGAGLSSTASDYARFCQMLLNGGSLDDVKILSPSSIKQMTTNQVGDSPIWGKVDGYRYGFGMGVVTRQGLPLEPAAGSYYWSGLFGSTFWVDPQNEIIGVLMVNVWPGLDEEFHNKFKAAVYSGLQ